MAERSKAFAAVIVGSVPGFVFPFVLSLTLGPREADTLLLVVAAAQLLTQVTGNTTETYVIAETGRALLNGGQIARTSLIRTRRRVTAYGASLACTVFPIILIAYVLAGKGALSVGTVMSLAVALFSFPIIATRAGVASGVLISSGDYAVPLVLQAVRTTPPVLLAAFALPIWLTAIGFSLGEILRVCLLEQRLRRRNIVSNGETGPSFPVPSYKQLLHQSASMFTSTLNPVVDRFFLLAVPGAIAVYEVADRIFFATSHGLNNGAILPTVRRWPRLVEKPLAEIRRKLAKDAFHLSLLGAAVSIPLCLLMLFLYLADTMSNVTISTGFLWAAILMPTLILTMVNTGGSRLVILSRGSWLLPVMAVSDLIVNLIADFALTSFYGPVGVPMGTVVLRLWIAAVYILIVVKLVIPHLSSGQDLAFIGAAGPARTGTHRV